MHFTVKIVSFEDFYEPRLAARKANFAEKAGWERLFLWNHLAYVCPIAVMDPCTALLAATLAEAPSRLSINIVPTLRGETVTHQGEFYPAQRVRLTPPSVQKAHPPIPISGESHPALRQAARWDGWKPCSDYAAHQKRCSDVWGQARLEELLHSVNFLRINKVTI